MTTLKIRVTRRSNITLVTPHTLTRAPAHTHIQNSYIFVLLGICTPPPHSANLCVPLFIQEMSLSGSGCLCLALSVSTCLCVSVVVSACLYLCLYVSVCLCMSLYASFCLCLSLIIFVCLSLSRSVSFCLCLSPPVSVCVCVFPHHN